MLAAGVFCLVGDDGEGAICWPGAGAFRSWSRCCCWALGVYIRAKVTETPVFTAGEGKRPPLKAPALEAIRRNPRNFLVVVGARLAENGLGYLYPVFGLSYLINTLHVPREVAIIGVMLGNFALIFGHHFLRLAVGPDRAAAGLYVRRAVLGGLRLSLLPAGRTRSIRC